MLEGFPRREGQGEADVADSCRKNRYMFMSSLSSYFSLLTSIKSRR